MAAVMRNRHRATRGRINLLQPGVFGGASETAR
jgi:hypothetical protein